MEMRCALGARSKNSLDLVQQCSFTAEILRQSSVSTHWQDLMRTSSLGIATNLPICRTMHGRSTLLFIIPWAKSSSTTSESPSHTVISSSACNAQSIPRRNGFSMVTRISSAMSKSDQHEWSILARCTERNRIPLLWSFPRAGWWNFKRSCKSLHAQMKCQHEMQ